MQEISEISRGLKQLAKELNVPVIALSQLSRAVEQREDKSPQLSDLGNRARSSRTPTSSSSSTARIITSRAKQPADDHPDFAAWQEEMARAYGRAEVIVAKQRHGATGKVRLKFDSRITKFSDAVDEGYLPEMRA